MLVRGTGIELGLPAYLGDQASALREAGWNYESAVWHHGQVGLNETWPILALRMLGEGYAWPQVVLELGLPNDYWYNGGADGGGGGGGGG